MTDRARAIRKESKRLYGFGTERMQQIKVCEHCGAMTKASKLFCPECAKLLPKETVYVQYQKRHRCCPSCGRVVSKGMQFCPDCGRRLNETDPE